VDDGVETEVCHHLQYRLAQILTTLNHAQISRVARGFADVRDQAVRT